MRHVVTSLLLCTLALVPAVTAQEFKRPQIANRNIYHRSEILSNQSSYTLLPKGCILYIPENLAGKLVNAPTGKYVNWSDFYANNRAWIHRHEVSIEHAKGQKVFTESELERFKTNGKVVVAVLNNNLISVNKPQKK